MIEIVMWLMEHEGYSYTQACEAVKRELGGSLEPN